MFICSPCLKKTYENKPNAKRYKGECEDCKKIRVCSQIPMSQLVPRLEAMLPPVRNQKVDAAGQLLAAEAYYLTTSGWNPLTPARPGGIVRWRKGDGPAFTQEHALRMQKTEDNWPEVKP